MYCTVYSGNNSNYAIQVYCENVKKSPWSVHANLIKITILLK